MEILQTERLVLRTLEEGDVPALYSILSDSEMMKFYPAPFSYEKTENWVKRNLERYQKDGYGLWAVCLKETNELIGDCGLVTQEVEGDVEVEIAYHIDRKYWSLGYGTEAARACQEYGFKQLGLKRMISIIDPNNLQSIRVAEKGGLKKEKEVFIFDKTHAIYVCNRP